MKNRYSIAEYQKKAKVLIVLLLVFFFFNFTWNNTANIIICQFLWLAYLVFILLLISSKIFENIYEPPLFLLLFSFLYEITKFPFIFNYINIYDFLVDNYLGSPTNRVADYYSAASMMYIYQIGCIIVLVISYSLFKKNEKFNDFRTFKIKNQNLIIYFTIFFICVGAFFLYTLTRGNILLFLAKRSGNLDETSVIDDTSYLLNLSTKLPLILIPILISLRNYFNKSWKSFLVLFVLAILLSYLMTGNRGNVFFSILGLFIVLKIDGKIKLSEFRLLIIGICFVMAFGILGILRRSVKDTKDINFNDNLKTNSEWYYDISNYQMQLRDEMVMEYADKVGFLYGESYLNIFFAPIPRSIAGDFKPVFLDNIVAVKFWNMNWTALPLNSMGESYYNFGFIGIFIFALYGVLMANWTNWLTSYSSHIHIIFSIILFFYLQTWCSTYLVYGLQYFIIVMLFFKMMGFKSVKLIKPKKFASFNKN